MFIVIYEVFFMKNYQTSIFSNIFFKISYNGKGLGEGGDKKAGNSNQTRTEQKPFSFFQNYKK